jgi:carboxylesterase type B
MEGKKRLVIFNTTTYIHSEIGLVFGSIEYQQQYYSKMSNQMISFPDTVEQKKLTKTMMTAWASFAKDPENALEKMGWPAYNPEST